MQVMASSDSCGVCGRSGGVDCWGCGSLCHMKCVAWGHRKRQAMNWLCGVCYQKFARAFFEISNSEAWQERRRKWHLQTQTALVAESRPYGFQSELESIFDGENLQSGKGSNAVDEELVDDTSL